MNGLEFFLFGDASADIVDYCSEGRSHGDFHQADVVHGTGKSEDFGTFAGFSADTGIPPAAVQHDLGHVGQRFHVVQYSGFFPQALLGRKGWTGPRHAALAFNGSHQRGFFTANKCPGTLIDFNVKIETGPQNIFSQQP